MRSTRRAAAANSSTQRLMSSLLMAATGQPVSNGICRGRLGNPAALRLAQDRLAPPRLRKLHAELRHPEGAAEVVHALERLVLVLADHMPAQRGEIRPRGLTFVISHITSPAAPSDMLPRCIRCQSFADPLSELYWHIGDTTIRFGKVSPRIVIGEKRALVID